MKDRVKIDLIAIYSLMVIGLFTGWFSAICGGLYAYIRRSSVAGLPEEKEYSDAIKVFWISSLILFIPVLIVLFMFVIPFFTIFAIATIGAIIGH